jgi:predicted secreted protein
MNQKMKTWGGLRAVIAFGILAFILNYPGMGGVRVVHAQQAQPKSTVTGFSWEYQLDFKSDSLPDVNQLSASLAPALISQGVTSNLKALGDTNYQYTFTGKLGLEQVRQVIYSPLLAGFINGAGEVEIDMPVGSLLDLPVMLDSKLSTGYNWEFQPSGNAGYAQTGESNYVTRSSGYGVPELQTLHLHPGFTGNGKIRLVYRRPFEPNEAITRHLYITLAAQALGIDLSDPQPQTPEASISSSVQPNTPNPIAAIPLRGSLPSSWDWRTAGIMTPVRNQGSCGSCWAFGTVGIMESAILKSGGPATDLSEQFLVSCNYDQWDCGGGWTAHKYHFDKLGRNQTVIGAVLEADKPYTATDGSCTVAYNHPYQLSGWSFIVSNESSMPTVEQIKNAIYTYGPVTAGVCADDGWNRYTNTSGVYTPTTNGCRIGTTPSTNHQIDIVGWEDATQSWIIRNSWGSGWGENGYMHIHWDPTGTTSRVGEGTSWVAWTAPGPVPFGKSSPTNAAVDVTGSPTLSWNASSDATSYEYCLVHGFTHTCATSWISTNSATSLPLSNLANGTWSWQVRAHNSAGTTEANAGAWWSFLVGPPVRVFLPINLKK